MVFDNNFRRGQRNVRQKYFNFLLIWKNRYSYLRASTKRKHFREYFYVCNVTFRRLKRKHSDAKPDGPRFCTGSTVLMHVISFFYKGVEACLGFQMMQKRQNL